MRIALVALALLAGCHHAHESPDAGDELPDLTSHVDAAAAPDLSAAATCAVTTTFQPTQSNPVVSIELPQQTVASTPVYYCLQLEGSGVPDPYFHANTNTMGGASSGVTLTLLGAGSVVLATSMDVTFTLDGPASSAQLSWLQTSGAYVDVVLEIVATDGQSHDVVVNASFGSEFG